MKGAKGDLDITLPDQSAQVLVNGHFATPSASASVGLRP